MIAVSLKGAGLVDCCFDGDCSHNFQGRQGQSAWQEQAAPGTRALPTRAKVGPLPNHLPLGERTFLAGETCRK